MRHDIGHTYIDSEVGRFEFYPTFKNIRSICDPEDVAGYFANLNGVIQQKSLVASNLGFNSLVNSYSRSLYQLCTLIMQSCCDDDITPLVGRIRWEKSAKHFKLGVMPVEHMISFSKILLKHGLIGIPSSGSKSNKKCDKIDVYDFVHLAMAHLDMSKEQAENLTKTEFDKLMMVKFPEEKKPSDNAPSDEEYYEAMAMLDKIDASRGKK